MITKSIQKPKYEQIQSLVGHFDVTIYVTEDGCEFQDEHQAKRHEWNISVKRHVLNIPYYPEVYFFRNEADLKEYEKNYVSGYGVRKKYDKSKFLYPMWYATYQDQSNDEEDDYCSEFFIIPFEEFKENIILELESLKS